MVSTRSIHAPSFSRLAVPISSSTAAISCRNAASGSACSRHVLSNLAASASRPSNEIRMRAARRSCSTRSSAAACFSTSRSRATTKRCRRNSGVERYAPRRCDHRRRRRRIQAPRAFACASSSLSRRRAPPRPRRAAPRRRPASAFALCRAPAIRLSRSVALIGSSTPSEIERFISSCALVGPVLVRNRSAAERAAAAPRRSCSQPEPTPRRARHRRWSASSPRCASKARS